MPAEVARLTWTPTRRDRWFIGVIAAATVAVVIGILAAGIGASHAARDAARGCVRYERAGFMGAQQELRCGAAAARICRATPIPHGLSGQCARIARVGKRS